ncbi:hypothetical protein LTR48_000364 [Friedmanniomyces endolithicus]|uniref:AMP-dependent synthetase/ligase domain-containing protein n=1 Tax=Rachicladosporium monterosium TaxID=1507873 RepID=A0ABR0LGW7_9PEZI|nr:hypothetical protein LTR48_000364 [Friedmanniomyces endolithicus]KAK5148561.1 hypothetical protein LTR32_000158 [Rachicladosporium monterosium]
MPKHSRTFLPKLSLVLDDGLEPCEGWTSIQALASEGQEYQIDMQRLSNEARKEDADRVALVMFTSGTSTGTPKGFPQRDCGLAQVCDIQQWGAHWGPSSRILCPPANFRIIAPTIAISAWKVGATLVMPSTVFDPERTLEAVEKHGITTMFFAPAQFHAVAAHPNFNASNIGSVSDILTGGDMITRDLLLKMSAVFPGATVMPAHGMTEGGGLFEWNFFKTSVSDLPYSGEISPLGMVAKGARVRIWNTDAGTVATRNEAGELHACNESITRHYLGNCHEDSFYEDAFGRWFKTGDLGLINQEGVIYILGRSKDVIKYVSLCAAEIATVVHTLTTASHRPIDEQVAVVAVASPIIGQGPFAVVADFNGKDDRQIRKCVLDLFGKDYHLAGVASLQQLGLDAFPLNTTGKVQKLEFQTFVDRYLTIRSGGIGRATY